MVKKEYHAFLASTVQFLHEIQERQMLWHWSPQSPVFDAVVWLQGLWASRHAVSHFPFSLWTSNASASSHLWGCLPSGVCTELRRTQNACCGRKMDLANTSCRITKKEASSSSKWLCTLRQAASGRVKRCWGGMLRWWSIWMTWLILSINQGALRSSSKKAGWIIFMGFQESLGKLRMCSARLDWSGKWTVIAEWRLLQVFFYIWRPNKTRES